MAGVRRLSIDGLVPEVDNALVIGVIIAKQNINRFVSKKDGLERAVWNFVLRDSPHDTINVTWWGSVDGAMNCCHMFTIGDVVEITCPRIRFIQPGDPSAKFRPNVSSPFEMELQERHSEILPHVEADSPFIRELMHLPTKSSGDFLRLSDITGRGQSMVGRVVNLLVVVAELGAVRPVSTRKESTTVLCRDLVVFDQTARDFLITIWNEDILHWSDVWKPRETVLFLADVRINMNQYKRIVTANLISCSIITADPQIPEASALRAYAATVPVKPTALLDHLSNIIVDPSKIDALMTTAQILDKAYNGDGNGGQFTALLYAYVTRYNLDGLDRVLIFKCVSCGHIQDNDHPCLGESCQDVNAPKHPSFSVLMDLTDHRGTLKNCRLEGSRAARVIGCTEESFAAMEIQQRTERKWRLLLERCEVRVVVLCPAANRPSPLISIITCSAADRNVVATQLPVY